MEERRDGNADIGMNAGMAASPLLAGEDDDFLDEPRRRPLWQWIIGGLVGTALFAGLVVVFTDILGRQVPYVPAETVLRELTYADGPAAAPGVTKSAAPASAPAPVAAPAAPQPLPSQQAEASPAPEPSAPAVAALPEGPRIVLLLADAGANPVLTRRAIEQLPPEVAIGFNPYPAELPALVQAARAKGHEIWLGIPMEPQRYPQVDPGPQALLLASSPAQNLKRLEWALRRVDGEVGLYSIMGSAFTTNAEALRPILTAMAEKGLPFLDSRATGRTRSARIAGAVGLPLLVNNSFVGGPAGAAEIDGQLATLERLAKARGLAVGVIEPSALALERIGPWAAGLSARNVSLVPPRALLDAEAAERRG